MQILKEIGIDIYQERFSNTNFFVMLDEQLAANEYIFLKKIIASINIRDFRIIYSDTKLDLICNKQQIIILNLAKIEKIKYRYEFKIMKLSSLQEVLLKPILKKQLFKKICAFINEV